MRELERHRDRTAMHVARSIAAQHPTLCDRVPSADGRYVREVASGSDVHCPRGCPGEESHACARTQHNIFLIQSQHQYRFAWHSRPRIPEEHFSPKKVDSRWRSRE